MFSLGILELTFVIVLFAVTAVLSGLRKRSWRLTAVLSVCCLLGAMVTPADPASMLLVGVPLFLTFVAGIWCAPLVRA